MRDLVGLNADEFLGVPPLAATRTTPPAPWPKTMPVSPQLRPKGLVAWQRVMGVPPFTEIFFSVLSSAEDAMN